MPAVTLNLYDIFRRKQASGTGAVDLSALTVKCMIVTGTYSPNQNTHDFADDLGANEVSGTNYAAGGNTLANPVVALDGSGNVSVDFDDPATWAQHASGFNDGRRAIIYVDRGGAASADELIGYTDDFGAAKGNVDGDFSVTINASGLFTSAR
jgi:hypothetical protein